MLLIGVPDKIVTPDVSNNPSFSTHTKKATQIRPHYIVVIVTSYIYLSNLVEKTVQQE